MFSGQISSTSSRARKGERLKLVGLLDSPYVRKLAIALQLMELEFQHVPLSEYSTYDAFSLINPVAISPTLVCDDGTVLMESGLIVQFASVLSKNTWSTLPNNRRQRARRVRLEGLALAVTEKAVQYVSETRMRPMEKRHEPWRIRVATQLAQALDLLNRELAAARWDFTTAEPHMAEVTAAVAWTYCLNELHQIVDVDEFIHLDELTRQAEQLSAFRRAPHSVHAFPFTRNAEELA